MEKCRICENKLPEPFLKLGPSPISNSFRRHEQAKEMEPFFPLDVYLCEKCFLVQIDEIEDPKKIFCGDYVYFSSYSDSWLKHCEKYVDKMAERFGYNSDSFVVEVGSNDGGLLQFFHKKGIKVLGVEPSTATADVAISKGVTTDKCFFNTQYGLDLESSKGQKADLILGNNVFAHNPNLHDFVGGIKAGLTNNGVVTLEFPHLLKMIAENQFDTVYHEHYSYLSLYSTDYLFKMYDLEVFDVEELPTHGGSLRVFGKHKEDKSKEISSNVSKILKCEEESGLNVAETYTQFRERVEKTKRDLLECLISLKNENKRCVGYGAPAKGNTLLNYCGIKTDLIDYTVDRNTSKQNMLLPGTAIPVKSPDFIKEDKPDYVLILPWNIKDEIIEQMSYIREWGGKFIIPIPGIEVI